MLSRPTFLHQNSMFDTSPLPQKPKLTPPPSPIQKMKTPFSRTGSPVSFRARSTFRATILILAFVLIVSVANEFRCASSDCLTRVGLRESSWVGGGSVIPESIKNKMNGVVEYIDGDDGRKEGEGEAAQVWDEGDDKDPGYSSEGVLVEPMEDVTEPVQQGKEAGSGRWIDESQGRELGEEIRRKKPEFLTVPGAFPIVKGDGEGDKTSEKMVDEIWKPEKPTRDVERYFVQGGSGVEQHAKWEQGEGQEDPVRVSDSAAISGTNNESEAVVSAGHEGTPFTESKALVVADSKAVAVVGGKSSGGDLDLPQLGAMALDSSRAIKKQ